MTTTALSRALSVDLHNMHKTYGDQSILHDVDLACPAGNVTTIVGPSGCGKTTLLRCIAGLENLNSGRIQIGDREVTHVDATRRGVAMVFQNYGLYPAKTVRENISFPLRMARVPRVERDARTGEAARMLRIGELLDRRPAQLSGGQRQRVGIARAIVREPSVLLMDEPLSNLDAHLRTDMRAELLTLQRKLRTTMIYVTHDQTEALTMADNLVVMNGGRIEQNGPPAEIFNCPRTTFVAEFLGGMNLLPSDLTRTAVRPPPHANVPPQGTIGIRPEDATLTDPGPTHWHINGRITLVELLGTSRLVHLELPDASSFRAKIPADIALTDHLGLSVPEHQVHLFDAHGRRLP
jgi:ABC-type sugar transport system ATPase subunit